MSGNHSLLIQNYFYLFNTEKNLVYGWMDDSMIELISDKEEMPIEVINHLQKHGKVISIYHLNRNSI